MTFTLFLFINTPACKMNLTQLFASFLRAMMHLLEGVPVTVHARGRNALCVSQSSVFDILRQSRNSASRTPRISSKVR